LGKTPSLPQAGLSAHNAIVGAIHELPLQTRRNDEFEAQPRSGRGKRFFSQTIHKGI